MDPKFNNEEKCLLCHIECLKLKRKGDLYLLRVCPQCGVADFNKPDAFVMPIFNVCPKCHQIGRWTTTNDGNRTQICEECEFKIHFD